VVRIRLQKPEPATISAVSNTIVSATGLGHLWHVQARDRSDNLAGLLIDCEEVRTLRAVPVGMRREAERRSWSSGYVE
jgi:hypothetical protein